MDVHAQSMDRLASQLRGRTRPYPHLITARQVLYRILKLASLVLAALIAPLAYLTKRPTVPAVLGAAIVIIEAVTLIFHLNDVPPRPRGEP